MVVSVAEISDQSLCQAVGLIVQLPVADSVIADLERTLRRLESGDLAQREGGWANVSRGSADDRILELAVRAPRRHGTLTAMRGPHPFDSVEVWLVEMTEDGPLGLHAARELLTPQERSAADRHHRVEDRSRSLIAQAALRRLVAMRTGADPRSVRIGRDERGRPLALCDPALGTSLSHAGAFVACAVAGYHVGIDIERSDRPEADDQLARRICSPPELHELAQTPPQRRPRALVRLWVRKEALAKALGVGLKLPFATVDARHDTPVLAGEVLTDWTIRDLEAPDGYLAAVAAPGHRWRIRAQLYSALAPLPTG